MRKILMLLTNAFLPDPRPYKEALSLIKAGNKVKILCWDRGENLPENEIIDGIKIGRIHLASKHGRGTSQIIFLAILWMRMLSRLMKEEFDIIYCHDFDTFPIGLILKIFKRKKVIFDSHEVFSKMLSRNVALPVKLFIKHLEKLLIKKADFVIVTCQAMGELYKTYGVKNIAVIGNWKEPRDFQIPHEALEKEKKAFGIKDELVVSYIANLSPERVIIPLLEIAQVEKSIFLIIGGSGTQSGIVKKAAQESENIKYLGYVPYSKVALYTALADVIYYGYNRNAGMAEFNSPNKLFEALASGKAFIGGNFGEMGRIINEEDCGIALDIFDKDNIKKAIEAMKDKSKLHAFQDNARKAGLERYNWTNAEKDFLEVFSKMERRSD